VSASIFAKLHAQFGEIDIYLFDPAPPGPIRPSPACSAVLHFARDERDFAAISTLGGRLADPLKTTNVQNMRCMTTWVVEKSP
jgi:hypothetical protein